MTNTTPSSAAGYDLYWGEFHKHLTGPGADIEQLDAVLEAALSHLDIQVVLCYPFKWYRKGREGGIREESVGGDSDFEDWWTTIQDAARVHNDPGTFVTFPGYEWHGDRTRWGDHNIIYREEGYPLDPTWDLSDLYEVLRSRPAIALPHHTAYAKGHRGADWDIYDPELSPVTEVYSSHGSSEGTNTPIPMDKNEDMGPSTSDGTWQAALDRGHRIGAIASNDGPGFPGTWGNGIAGVWARKLTRESIWEAIRARRTYGVTGDRIRLWWEIDSFEMGSVIQADDPTGRAIVSCPRPLSRIELIHDGRTVESYAHHPSGDRDPDGVYSILVEFGWGPNADYGDFDDSTCSWHGTIDIDNGTLRGVIPRFGSFGQQYEITDGACHFSLRTSRGMPSNSILPEGTQKTSRQGLFVSFEGDGSTTIHVDLADTECIQLPLSIARKRTHVFALLEESYARLENEFELSSDDIENPDIVYHNSRKIKVHTASPRADRVAEVVFSDLPIEGDQNYYYIRAAQVNGQYAWSSPIWINTT